MVGGTSREAVWPWPAMSLLPDHTKLSVNFRMWNNWGFHFNRMPSCSMSQPVKRVGVHFWETIILPSVLNPPWLFKTIIFSSSSSSHLRLSSRVQFTICIWHKIVRSIVYAIMDSLDKKFEIHLCSKLMEIVVTLFHSIIWLL